MLSTLTAPLKVMVIICGTCDGSILPGMRVPSAEQKQSGKTHCVVSQSGARFGSVSTAGDNRAEEEKREKERVWVELWDGECRWVGLCWGRIKSIKSLGTSTTKWTPNELNYSRFTYSTHSRPIRPCIRAFHCRKALSQCTRRYRTRVFLPDRLARRFWKLEALFWALKKEQKKEKTPVREERYGKQQEKDIRKMSKDRLSAAMLCFSTRHTQPRGGKGNRTQKSFCVVCEIFTSSLALFFFVFIPTNVTSHHRQVLARSPCSYFFALYSVFSVHEDRYHGSIQDLCVVKKNCHVSFGGVHEHTPAE